MEIDNVDPFGKELEAHLKRASASQQRAAALAAARFALAHNALTDSVLSDAMNALAAGRSADKALTERLQALVDSLDEVHWDLQEKEEAGQATEAEHLAAFQKARAANTVLAALAADPFAAASDSAYEAFHATKDLPGLRVVILAALRAGG